jgi:hypothetical protein
MDCNPIVEVNFMYRTIGEVQPAVATAGLLTDRWSWLTTFRVMCCPPIPHDQFERQTLASYHDIEMWVQRLNNSRAPRAALSQASKSSGLRIGCLIVCCGYLVADKLKEISVVAIASDLAVEACMSG